jgi:hypothetical protein
MSVQVFRGGGDRGRVADAFADASTKTKKDGAEKQTLSQFIIKIYDEVRELQPLSQNCRQSRSSSSSLP